RIEEIDFAIVRAAAGQLLKAVMGCIEAADCHGGSHQDSPQVIVLGIFSKGAFHVIQSVGKYSGRTGLVLLPEQLCQPSPLARVGGLELQILAEVLDRKGRQFAGQGPIDLPEKGGTDSTGLKMMQEGESGGQEAANDE